MRCRIAWGHWQAEVCPRLGANVTRLSKDGEDVLVPLTDEAQLVKNPYLQGAPLLFPANRTANGRFQWMGRTYQMPVNEAFSGANLHGFLHRQVFQVVQYTDNSISMIYRHRPDENFPFAFCMNVTYRLDAQGFTQSYVLENTDEVPFPFTFSLHTTFQEPQHFSVPISCCQEKDSCHIPTGRYVPLNIQEQDYVCGSASTGKIISGYYLACGHCAQVGNYRYTVSDNFDHFILFNGRGESGLLCVEPQCGAVNGLNIPDGHRVLEPGQSMIFTCNIC